MEGGGGAGGTGGREGGRTRPARTQMSKSGELLGAARSCSLTPSRTHVTLHTDQRARPPPACFYSTIAP